MNLLYFTGVHARPELGILAELLEQTEHTVWVVAATYLIS